MPVIYDDLRPITRADLDRFGRAAVWANRAGALDEAGKPELAEVARTISARGFEPFSPALFSVLLYLHHSGDYPSGKPN